MGRWVDTVLVAHADLEVVGPALAAVCAEEGMVVGPAPLPRKRHLVEPLQYDGALHNDLWVIALFPGAPGWTVIRSAPLMRLAESRATDGAMRLARLCAMLGTSGFALHLHDGSNLVFAEATAAGDVVISGFDASAPGDPLVFLGRRIDEARVEPVFHRHPARAALIGRDRGADESADDGATRAPWPARAAGNIAAEAVPPEPACPRPSAPCAR